jgi:hypothetical protein
MEIIINESQYGKIIYENVNLRDYYTEDFVEVFYEKFRPWIRINHGDEVGKYPMSFLIKKYAKDFAKSVKYRDYIGDNFTPLTLMDKLGQHIVLQGHILPTLSKDFKFTEKYKLGIEKLVNSLNLPSFATIRFEESTPFNVYCFMDIDFFKYITSDLNRESFTQLVNSRHILVDYFEKFMGVNFGDSIHGDLEIDYNTPPIMIGEEEWVHYFLNKKIKKEIKSLPKSHNLFSVKYSRRGFNPTIKLTFRRNTRWNDESEFIKNVKNYLSENGYNLNLLGIH